MGRSPQRAYEWHRVGEGKLISVRIWSSCLASNLAMQGEYSLYLFRLLLQDEDVKA